jgi:FkbM family methyltransferase
LIIAQAQRALDAYRHWRERTSPGALGPFYRSGGNQLLYERLPLSSSDWVIDAGGFEGDWSAEIMVRYGCRSLVFEPVPEFQERISQRLERNDRVVLVKKGIGGRTETIGMHLNGPGSRVLRSEDRSEQQIVAEIQGVAEVFARPELAEIGCMKINIEGAEYELLDQILRLSLASRVRVLIIQFHQFGAADPLNRRERIQAGLARSHRKVFDYPFVWERWDRIE